MTERLIDKLAASPLTRRHVFVGAGTAGALAAAATVMPRSQPDVAAKVAELATSKEEGYQLTDHVRRYYETARV